MATDEVQRRPGGLSGKPGFPGRAGAFAILPVGKAEIPPKLKDWVAAQPGTRTLLRVRTPGWKSILANPSRCTFTFMGYPNSFSPEPHPAYPKPAYPKGVERDDNVFIPADTYSFEEMLPQIYLRLAAISLRLDSKLDQNLSDNVPAEQVALSPVELLHLYLLKNTNEARSRLVDGLIKSFQQGGDQGDFGSLWPVLAAGDPSVYAGPSNPTGLDTTTLVMLADASALRADRRLKTAWDYLEHVGGLMPTLGDNPFSKIDSAAARTQLAQISGTLAEVRQDLKELRIDVLNILDVQARTYFEGKLESVKKAIKAAQDEENKLGDTFARFSNTATKVSAAVGAFASDNYLAGAKAVYDAVQTIPQIYEEVNHSRSEALQKNYDAMQNDFNSFLQYLEERKDTVVRSRYTTYNKLRSANQHYLSAAITAGRQFNSILKLIVLTYLKDRDQNRLISNLRKLKDLVDNFPNTTGDFDVQKFDEQCTSTRPLNDVMSSNELIHCVDLPVGETDYVLGANITGAEQFGELPLIRVPKGQRVSNLNLFGLIKGTELHIGTR